MNTPDIRKIDFKIPIYWTDEQALAVFELIDDLKEKIFAHYGLRIQDAMAAERQPETNQIETGDNDQPF